MKSFIHPLFLILSLALLKSLAAQSPPSVYKTIGGFYQENPRGDTINRGGFRKGIDRMVLLGLPNLYPHGNPNAAAASYQSYVHWANANTPGMHPFGSAFPYAQQAPYLKGGEIGNTGKQAGQMHRITLHPDYGIGGNQTIFAVSGFGGAYTSLDNGLNWTNLNTDFGLPTTSVSDIAVAKHAGTASNQVLYLSTGNADFAGIVSEYNSVRALLQFFSNGVYKSLNGGATWERLQDNLFSPSVLEPSDIIRRMVVQPGDSSLLVMATNKGIFYCVDPLDAYPTWLKIHLHNMPDSNFNAQGWRGLEFHPENPNILYASGSGSVVEIEFDSVLNTVEEIRYLMKWDGSGIQGFKNMFDFPCTHPSLNHTPRYRTDGYPDMQSWEDSTKYGEFLPYRVNIAVVGDTNTTCSAVSPYDQSHENSHVFIYVVGYVLDRVPIVDTSAKDCSLSWECGSNYYVPGYTCPIMRPAFGVYRFNKCDTLELIMRYIQGGQNAQSKKNCRPNPLSTVDINPYSIFNGGSAPQSLSAEWMGISVIGNNPNKVAVAGANGFIMHRDRTPIYFQNFAYGTSTSGEVWADKHDIQSIPGTNHFFLSHHGGVSWVSADSILNSGNYWLDYQARNKGLSTFLAWEGDVHKTGKRGEASILHDMDYGFVTDKPNSNHVSSIIQTEGWVVSFLGNHSKHILLEGKGLKSRTVGDWFLDTVPSSAQNTTLPKDPAHPAETVSTGRVPTAMNILDNTEYIVGLNELFTVYDNASFQGWKLRSDIWRTFPNPPSPGSKRWPTFTSVEQFLVSPQNPDYIYVLMRGEIGKNIPHPITKESLVNNPSHIYVSTTGLADSADAADISVPPIFKRISIEDSSCVFLDTAGLDPPLIFDIGVSQLDPQKCWAIAGGYDNRSRFFVSTNAGQSWEPLGADGDYTSGSFTGYPPSLPARRLFLQPGTETAGSNGRPRMFVGTDAGVYYLNPDTNGWQFYAGLPRVSVTSMTYNPCENTLQVTTFGRGTWELSLPEPDGPLPVGLIINQNTTWVGNRALISSVRLTNGATLIINDTLKMPHRGAIFVEPGCKLTVNGTVTTACDGAMWQGIMAIGNSNQAQTLANQGYVFLNGATLEHARTGVSNWKSGDWSSIGGIISAQNSTFLNCRRALEYYHFPYTVSGAMPAYVGSVSNCTFTVDDNFRLGDDGFKSHVTLWKVRKVRFMGCRFEDLRSSKPWQEYTKGMYSIDAHYEVLSRCNGGNPTTFPGGTCSPAQVQPSSFFGFSYGIHSTGASAQNALSAFVDESKFRANVWGMRYDDNHWGWVSRSRFELVDDSLPIYNGSLDKIGIHGLFLNNSELIRVQENDFNGEWMGTSDNRAGIQWLNGGLVSNLVYLNRFKKLRTTEFYLSNNRNGLAPWQGLQSRCNLRPDSVPSTFGIQVDRYPLTNYSSDEGVAEFQSTKGPSTQGGSFNRIGSVAESDIRNLTGNNIYWYHNGGISEPLYVTPTKVGVFLTYTSPSCDSINLPPGMYPNYANDVSTLKQQAQIDFQQKQIEYGNLLYTYKQTLDQGFTSHLIQQVQGAWSQDAWEMRDSLMDMAPYLSQTVLSEAALTGVMPHAMLLEVCLANVDATMGASFLNMLRYDIPNPMPEYMVLIIEAAWGTAGPLTQMKSSLAELALERDQTLALIFQAMQSDSLYYADSLLYWRMQRGEVSDYYAQANYFADMGERDTAEATYQAMEDLFSLEGTSLEEWEDFGHWLQFKLMMSDSTWQIDRLSEANQDSLLWMAENLSGSASGFARNILCFFYDTCPPMPEPPTSKPSEENLIPRSLAVPDCGLFPNPASAKVMFHYGQGVAARFALYSMEGRELINIALQEKPVSYTISVEPYPPGLYLYQIKNSQGMVLCQGKLIVQKQ